MKNKNIYALILIIIITSVRCFGYINPNSWKELFPQEFQNSPQLRNDMKNLVLELNVNTPIEFNEFMSLDHIQLYDKEFYDEISEFADPDEKGLPDYKGDELYIYTTFDGPLYFFMYDEKYWDNINDKTPRLDKISTLERILTFFGSKENYIIPGIIDYFLKSKTNIIIEISHPIPDEPAIYLNLTLNKNGLIDEINIEQPDQETSITIVN